MNLALLKGNRFNPWHLQAFNHLDNDSRVTAFRARSEIQEHFEGRDDGSLICDYENIYFDTQAGPLWRRIPNRLDERLRNREPRILPFFDRLKTYDVVQSWELFTDWTAQAVTARKRFGTPLAVMVWDNIPFNMERNPQRRAAKQAAIETADKFLVHTERSRRVLDIEGVPANKISLVLPGVDVNRFAPGKADRAAFGLDDDEFVILFVGWMLPRKGIDFLLLALRELINDPSLKGKRIRLMTIGSGPGQERVDTLVQRLNVQDHCSFIGSASYDRMPDAFRASDVFVLPSIAMPEWQEQFGMSLIEAMASGLPVVSTYSGAIPEIVGDAGILCQPNDFVALHDSLKDLIENPAQRTELGEAARARAVEYFSLEDYAASLAAIYDSMLAA